MTPDHRKDSPAEAPQAPRTVSSSWRTIGRALAPRLTKAQVMAGLLSALVGFALVVQVQQNRTDGFAGLRQDELVRLLDDTTRRSDELEREAASLRQERAALVTGSDTQRAAREAAEERAEVQGILAGRLPAEGPGISLVIHERDRVLPAHVLYNVLEELRNAGAEAVQLNDLRLTASTYAIDTPEGIEVDGTLLEAPYRWLVIGDPDTMTTALSIPGGALASVRNESGTTVLDTRSEVSIEATRTLEAPTYATPAPAPETD